VTSRDGVEYFLGPPWSRSFDLGMIFGEYFGYPLCCVEAHCQRQSSPDGFHPLSGHRLCIRCDAGPMAPLPVRPADRFGLILPPNPLTGRAPWVEEPTAREARVVQFGGCTFDDKLGDVVDVGDGA
jgi:hypothetical protein